jgi:hypothetical protein
VSETWWRPLHLPRGDEDTVPDWRDDPINAAAADLVYAHETGVDEDEHEARKRLMDAVLDAIGSRSRSRDA